MNRYKINPLLDTLRLVRGVFCKSCMDPYIETHPPRIIARKYLFQFSTIENEEGNYRSDFSHYTPYISSQPLLMQHLPEAYGRDAFRHLIAAKSSRLKQITQLLERDGIEVAPKTACWESIGKWVAEHIEENREPAFAEPEGGAGKLIRAEFMFRPVWYSILLDLTLLLGEHVIALRKACSWQFWGDMPLKSPGSYGRSPWILCEPLPKAGKWGHAPERLLPYETLSAMAATLLQNKLQKTTRPVSFGLMYHQFIGNQQTEHAGSDPEDSQVADILEWLETYKKTAVGATQENLQDGLDAFLQSYVAEAGILPPARDLQLLEDAFNGLPDWVKTYKPQ